MESSSNREAKWPKILSEIRVMDTHCISQIDKLRTGPSLFLSKKGRKGIIIKNNKHELLSGADYLFSNLDAILWRLFWGIEETLEICSKF